MAQASENVNVSQSVEKMFSFAQKMVTILQNCFLAKSGFLKIFDQQKKATPYIFATNPCATNSKIIMLLLQAPRSGPHEVRN